MQSCATRQKNKCYDSSVQVWTMDLLICYSLPWLPGDEPGDPGRTMIKTDILVSFNFSFLEDAQGARRDTSSPGGQRCPLFNFL